VRLLFPTLDLELSPVVFLLAGSGKRHLSSPVAQRARFSKDCIEHIAGVAGQSCCSGTAASGTGGTVPAFGTTASDCKSADVQYTWQFKTCPSDKKCRPFTCTVSTLEVTLTTLKYQDCYDDTTFKADMQAKSINSYKCGRSPSGRSSQRVADTTNCVCRGGVWISSC
jgi:hypothetical protein